MGRPEDFYRRLNQVCDDSVSVPEYGHGRQVYIAKKLKVTQEAVRKWFNGDSRPRTAKMRDLAKLLDVDEAWLSLGVEPEMDRREKNEHASRLDGAVHTAFGLFALAGGHGAFPGEKDPRKGYVDFYLIINGAQAAVHVCLGRPLSKDQYEFLIPHEYADVRCLGVVPHAGLRFHMIDLKAALLEEHKVRKAGGYAVTLAHHKGEYVTGSDVWPVITDVGAL